MTDQNTNNEPIPRTYTEEEVFELFQRFRLEEQATSQNSREEHELPMEIIDSLENLTKQQHQENFKRYKREISKYHHEEWTMGEEINKSFIPKLKNYTVDSTQVINAHYKGSEISRIHGRAATEIFEQLATIRRGNISPTEAQQLLEEAMESSKRLAIHAWIQARQHDEDAKDYATKALRLPASLRHLERKESGNKKEAFSTEFIEMYNEANYQQRVLRAATTSNTNGGHRGGYSSSSTWNSNRRGGRSFFSSSRGKNFYGGRGRRAPTYHNNMSNNSHNSGTQQHSSTQQHQGASNSQ